MGTGLPMPSRTILIDKSALQGLSLDEAAHLSSAYLVNTTPVLLAEILGDLCKATAAGRVTDAQQIARKFGGSGEPPNVDFRDLCFSSLLGRAVPMNGRVPLSGGAWVRNSNGAPGVIYDVSPQQEALMRWARGKFTDADMALAKRWREVVRGFSLADFDRHLRSRGIEIRRPRLDAALPGIIQDALCHDKPQEPWLLFLLDQLRLCPDDRLAVRRRWNECAPTTLQAFAPYAYFCLFALLAVLILWKHKLTKSEPANLVDVQYLYYLPFCHDFCSRDKLHRQLAPFLMRPDQRFIWGDELKKELRRTAEERPTHRGEEGA